MSNTSEELFKETSIKLAEHLSVQNDEASIDALGNFLSNALKVVSDKMEQHNNDPMFLRYVTIEASTSAALEDETPLIKQRVSRLIFEGEFSPNRVGKIIDSALTQAYKLQNNS